jgi:predicted RNA binding protein YcfA (HicA-like mRNA interferase family)
MKLRDVIRLLTDDGWSKVSQKGRHRQFRHPGKPGKVTVPGNLSDDLSPGTFNSTLRQAGLKQGD